MTIKICIVKSVTVQYSHPVRHEYLYAPIYVPAKSVELWQSGRKEYKMQSKIQSHEDIILDMFRLYAVIYEWIPGIDAAQAYENRILDEELMKSLTLDSEIIMGRVEKYVKKQMEILGILKKLPRFNCEKCGYSSCYDAAIAIYNGKIKLSDCPPLSIKQEMKTRITVHGVEIPIQPFVSEIIQSSIIGMISALKGVSIKGNERLHLELT